MVNASIARNEPKLAHQIRTQCPFCGGLSEPLTRLIPHLNDHHRISREDIASFVARIEDTIAQSFVTVQYAPASEPPVVDAEFVAELKRDLIQPPIPVEQEE